MKGKTIIHIEYFHTFRKLFCKNEKLIETYVVYKDIWVRERNYEVAMAIHYVRSWRMNLLNVQKSLFQSVIEHKFHPSSFWKNFRLQHKRILPSFASILSKHLLNWLKRVSVVNCCPQKSSINLSSLLLYKVHPINKDHGQAILMFFR